MQMFSVQMRLGTSAMDGLTDSHWPCSIDEQAKQHSCQNVGLMKACDRTYYVYIEVVLMRNIYTCTKHDCTLVAWDEAWVVAWDRAWHGIAAERFS